MDTVSTCYQLQFQSKEDTLQYLGSGYIELNRSTSRLNDQVILKHSADGNEITVALKKGNNLKTESLITLMHSGQIIPQKEMDIVGLLVVHMCI